MLTLSQVSAIVALLMAFGVDPSEVNKIEILLKPPVVQVLGSVTTVYQPTVSTSTPSLTITPQVIINPMPSTPAPVQVDAQIIAHDSTTLEATREWIAEHPTGHFYGVFLKDSSDQFMPIDLSKSIVMKVNGLVYRTAKRNSSILWDKDTHQPGVTFYYEPKEGDVISFEAEGLTKTL